MRNINKFTVEQRTLQHSALNDDCRVGIFEIAEHDRLKKDVAKDVNECLARLNANSHGQRVEKL